MATKSQRPKELESAVSSFNTAVEAMDRAEKTTSIPPAKTAFLSAKGLLTTIKVDLLSIRVGWPLINAHRIR